MKLKASLVVMSHLSDAQEMIIRRMMIWGNDHINFAKYVIMQCKGDLTKEIDADKLWLEFANSRFFSGKIFKHPELKEGEVFLINVKDGEAEDWKKSLSKQCKSLRLGNIAYVTDGSEIVTDYKPLFGKIIVTLF
jgi:hypothetical protein